MATPSLLKLRQGDLVVLTRKVTEQHLDDPDAVEDYTASGDLEAGAPLVVLQVTDTYAVVVAPDVCDDTGPTWAEVPRAWLRRAGGASSLHAEALEADGEDTAEAMTDRELAVFLLDRLTRGTAERWAYLVTRTHHSSTVCSALLTAAGLDPDEEMLP